MNNLVNIRPSNAFAHLDPNQSLGEGITSGMATINYPQRVWSLRYRGNNYPFVRPDDGTPAPHIDVIIVGINPNMSKLYYAGVYDERAANPPLCASLNGDVPDPGVKERQATSCGVCEHNIWKQLPTGRRGKECQDNKRLAVLLMPSVTAKMLGAPLTEPVFLKVPPGSLTTLKAYGDKLVHQGLPFASVITRIKFAPDKQFQMAFEIERALKDNEAPAVLPMMDDPQTKRILGLAPQISELPSPPPLREIEHHDKNTETGIAATFGIPAVAPKQQEIIEPVKRPRGRPPKQQTTSRAEEQPIQTNGPTQQPEETADPAKGELPWGETDTELDKEVNDLLGKKMEDMLK